ncbi:MarR family winged helix-turn-helix transcriptional regulator [Ruminiclostridium cellobioparum]|uniref:Transcriptional regulator n=1 Tax=Ruminiclostridium cellobioparum subsp. termitidis CT1112 TaxID=1195236 RepID=S0FNY6_RUMCE|nr:MarR family transcriptional regulator [Ruminiclostridium cellobioparum]EMS73617.1 transcriptional regulator [Ruminiclostridium cellobioparum subsp. termitidis CT1112]
MNYDSLKLGNQLCFPLYACSKEIIRKYKPFLDPLGLTYTQYIALMALWEEDNLTVKALGERLYLDSGTLTPLLKKMEGQKLIKRIRSSEDERNVYIKLTEDGNLLKDKAAAVPEQIGRCFSLSNEEVLFLHQTLHKILKQI